MPPFFLFVDAASLWRPEIVKASQRKLFSHGPHSSKNNYFGIKISRPTLWVSLSVLLWLLKVYIPWRLWFGPIARPEPAGKERGLRPRNDVLTTCKAVTLRGVQRIIALYFSQSKIFQRREANQQGNNSIIEKIIWCLFVFLAYRLCPLSLKLQSDRVNS